MKLRAALSVPDSETVWPPPTSSLAENTLPLSDPDTVPPVKHGEPVYATVPLIALPLATRFAEIDPFVSVNIFDTQPPCQNPVNEELGAVTTNTTGDDTPPPGAGFDTTTGKLPGDARSAALSVTVN